VQEVQHELDTSSANEVLRPPIDGLGSQQSIANAAIELVAAWSFDDIPKKRPSFDGAKPALRRD
jgi:hypothetical protein